MDIHTCYAVDHVEQLWHWVYTGTRNPVARSTVSSTIETHSLKRNKNSVSIMPSGTQKRVRFKCAEKSRLCMRMNANTSTKQGD